MKKHLVTLHCGQQIMAANPYQRFCNRKCSGYFISRRPEAKKRNRHSAVPTQKPSNNLCAVDSRDPAWTDARRYLTRKGYVLLSIYLPDLKISFSHMEHIIVWEKCHGVTLQKGWAIHHLNEQTDDNDPANLVALPLRLHRELHIKLRHLAEECRGIDYMVRRHALTQDFVRRATELSDLRRLWYEG